VVKMSKRGRPVTSGSDAFQSALLRDAHNVSEAYRRKFGQRPKSDTQTASLLRERADRAYSRYGVASLVTMLSRAKAAERRASLSERITGLIEALRDRAMSPLPQRLKNSADHSSIHRTLARVTPRRRPAVSEHRTDAAEVVRLCGMD
jgi:hypothetical protein